MRGKIVDRIRHMFWDPRYNDAFPEGENLEFGVPSAVRCMHA